MQTLKRIETPLRLLSALKEAWWLLFQSHLQPWISDGFLSYLVFMLHIHFFKSGAPSPNWKLIWQRGHPHTLAVIQYLVYLYLAKIIFSDYFYFVTFVKFGTVCSNTRRSKQMRIIIQKTLLLLIMHTLQQSSIILSGKQLTAKYSINGPTWLLFEIIFCNNP